MTAAILSTLALGACAADAPAMRDGGLATYDALRQAAADCEAKGGSLKLRPEGNSKRLDHYACERN